MRCTLVFFLFLLLSNTAFGYWQQKIDYRMEVQLDVSTNLLTGSQQIKYQNNSPQTLQVLYYHLYFNAFQPNSEMDVRSRSLPDPDKRVGARISKLNSEQIGYQKVIELTQGGNPLKHEVQGTILKVWLHKPIKAGETATINMQFEAQVPLQIRRCGRDNAEGIRYSMSQWYPKLCEYDEDGWHTDPYIGREFHGVWGNFDVKITLDSSYLVGGTGVLQNANQIGKGYEKPGAKVNRPASKELTWHFIAENVHDFVWAADPDFVHYSIEGPNKTIIHCIYQPDSITEKNWPLLAEYMSKAIQILNENIGLYPYPQYSFIQGGDGGMEYPMATLITGRRALGSLVGVSVHELVHSWFQGMLAFDESRYYWMDEGFTEFYSNLVMQQLFPSIVKKAQPGTFDSLFPVNQYRDAYDAYLGIATNEEQALSTHADWFETNRVYGIQAYNKGCVFLSQLQHMVGDSTFNLAFKDFFESWKMKHPKPIHLKQKMEQYSGMELDWYFEQMIYTTHAIDYAVQSVVHRNGKLEVVLQKNSAFPMPIELFIRNQKNELTLVYIPVDVQRANKPLKNALILKPWRWVDKTYSIQLDYADPLIGVYIDPAGFIADIKPENNQIEFRVKR